MDKLLILQEERVPNFYYGPPVATSNLVEFLQRKNVEVSVRSIEMRDSPSSYVQFKGFLSSMHYLARNFPSIVAAIKRSNVINMHYFKPLSSIVYAALVKLLNKPLILHVYFPILSAARLKAFTYSIDRFVVVNEYLAEPLRKEGIPSEKITCIPPAIDVNKYRPMDKDALLAKYAIPRKQFVVLYHGRASTVRGLPLFLRALRSLRERYDDLAIILSLATVEEDLSLRDIERWLREYGLEEATTLIQGRNDAAEMYNLADVVVFPFRHKTASMCPPLSLLEAMACGKITVCSDIEELGVRHIIKNGHDGFLVKPTESELINCLESVRELHVDKLNQIERNAIDTIREGYSGETVTDRLIQVMEEIC